MAKAHVIAIIFLILAILLSCRKSTHKNEILEEDIDAKSMLQGVWIDEEQETEVFTAIKDTIIYMQSYGIPSYFCVKGDTLYIGDRPHKYHIIKLSPNILIFENSKGDTVRLIKGSESFQENSEKKKEMQEIAKATILKRDTVVVWQGTRYRCYITINPTTYKVYKTTYNDSGMKIDDIYYDNIININVYKGAERLFSHDFSKAEFSKYVPENILEKSILSNMEYEKTDKSGFHFYTVICIPDETSCHMIDTKISFEGNVEKDLVEY